MAEVGGCGARARPGQAPDTISTLPSSRTPLILSAARTSIGSPFPSPPFSSPATAMAPALPASPCVLADQISSQFLSTAAAHHDNLPHQIPSQFVLPPHHRSPALAPSPDSAAIPVLDLADSDHPLFEEELHSACTQWGIFQVLNHGVPDQLLQHFQLQIEKFLALPVEDRCPRFLGNRGEGYGTGFVRKTTGVTEWRDCLRLSTYPYARRNYAVWPASPEFRKVLEDFSEEMRRLQLRMLGHMSQSLGLGAGRLEEIVGEMQQTILMNHYPPCPEPELAVGVDAHTDVGAITCLWQYDGVVGLHVLHEGSWLAVSPPRGSLTILVGDQVQRASNGIYKSAIHRGVLNPTKHRVSIVSFYQLRPEQVVTPACELIDDRHPLLYQPTQFKHHELAKK